MKKQQILLVLWVTSKCNLKCKYCYADACMQGDDMPYETAIAAVEKFKEYPLKVQFAGGEPLLNFSLVCRIIDYIEKHNYVATFQLQTNGTLIDESIAKGLKKRRVALGVSLDGQPQINEWLRGGTKLTVNGIRNLANQNVKVNVNTVVTAYNVKELHKLPDFVLYFGNVAGIGLDLLRSAGRGKKDINGICPSEPEELRKAMIMMHHRCEDLYHMTGVRIHLREVSEAKQRLRFSQQTKEYCYASCGRSIVILPNGDVYPCGSLIEDEDYFMGNIHGELLKPIALKYKDRSSCTNCRYQVYCPGSCPSRIITNQIVDISDSLDCVMKTAFEITEKI